MVKANTECFNEVILCIHGVRAGEGDTIGKKIVKLNNLLCEVHVVPDQYGGQHSLIITEESV